MTQNEIIEMAEQAGLWQDLYLYGGLRKHLEAFAKLVAEHEREACAKIAFNAKTYIEAAKAIRARGNQ